MNCPKCGQMPSKVTNPMCGNPVVGEDCPWYLPKGMATGTVLATSPEQPVYFVGPKQPSINIEPFYVAPQNGDRAEVEKVITESLRKVLSQFQEKKTKQEVWVVEIQNPDEFEQKVNALLNDGYKISSTSCAVLARGNYQAILMREVLA